MNKPAARIVIGGTGSGCGKTTVTCALLEALIRRGADLMAFKCGPDYIDPMFHSEIIGAPSANIDIFLAGRYSAQALFVKHARDLNIIEGVMGYYDGVSMSSDEGSACDVARLLQAPAVLVVNAWGMALSAAAVVKGFAALREDSRVAGVILNNVSPMLLKQLRPVIEGECGVRVYGCLPPCPEAALESRHLGLVTAQEIDDLRARMRRLGELAEQNIDIDALTELMRAAPELNVVLPEMQPVGSARIAVARDRAFCFYYRDNLELLQELGAELRFFSPLRDAELPECDGLYLGGGYPELYARELSENASMRRAVREAVQAGVPTVAECGGFMYLTQSISGQPMAGALPGDCGDTGKLVRFGYTTLSADEGSLLFGPGSSLRAHEFHYWDSDQPGETLTSTKPSGRRWRCAFTSDSLYAGFPHLYFYSDVEAAKRFVRKCAERRAG